MLYYLKRALENKTGLGLNSVKAYRMMEKILYEKGFFVSYSTLYRMFSVSKYQVNPRSETLNLLSRFLGYKSYEHFEEEHYSEDKYQETFFSNEIAFKGFLLNNEISAALELYEEIKEGPSEFLFEFAQILGKQLFNKENLHQKELEYLLNNEVKAPFFMEFFVYEDDPFGHFQWAIENLHRNTSDSTEQNLYTSLFTNRKKMLQGEKFEIPEIIDQKLSFHLLARHYELELLKAYSIKRKDLSKYLLDKTDELIDQILLRNNEYEKLVLIGRWNRAMVYTNTYLNLKGHSEWLQLSLSAFNSSIENLEFKAPVYAFLKLCFGLELPLDFYKYNRWENAVLESQLLISKALGNQKAVESYKKILKISLDI